MSAPPAAGLEALLAAVAEEARSEAEAVVAEGRRRAEAHLERAERETARAEARARDEGRAEGEREGRRRVALAQIDAQQAPLRSRSEALDRVLELAVGRVTQQLGGPDCARLLAGLVREAGGALQERKLRVKVRPEDRGAVASGLPGIEAELVLSEDALGEPGVCVFTLDGRCMVDLSLSGLVERRCDAARRAAAAVLFGEEETV